MATKKKPPVKVPVAVSKKPLKLTDAERRAQIEIELRVWELQRDGVPFPEIARRMQLEPGFLESIIPGIASTVQNNAQVLRHTVRESTLADITAAIAICRNIIKNPRNKPPAKLAAMDRIVKLYDRLAKSEGTDRHKDRLEVSGAPGSPMQLDIQAIAGIAEIRKAREAREAKEQGTLDVKAKPVK